MSVAASFHGTLFTTKTFASHPSPRPSPLSFRFSFFQEFSLAREQREEEVEKERLQREKEDARERERQARLEKLARLKALSKRRNAPRGAGGVSTNTAGEWRGVHSGRGEIERKRWRGGGYRDRGRGRDRESDRLDRHRRRHTTNESAVGLLFGLVLHNRGWRVVHGGK